MVDCNEIIRQAIQRGASDIHIINDLKPLIRINRELTEVTEIETLNEQDIKNVYDYFVCGNEELDKLFKEEKRLDFNFKFEGTRLRVNISISNGLPVFTARIVKNDLPRFKDLGLPEIVRRISLLPQGLILVTGKSNTGKSTTLNALVNEINQSESKKILMLENPIEYVHTSQKSLVVQKEVGLGRDVESFSIGAMNALREDCDILIIGEIRDRKTIDAALEMAESGHLVIGTMHTSSCAETIDRILNFYDLSDQMVVKYMISAVLKAVVAQRLLNGIDNELVMVPEVMIVDDTISGLIRKEKFSRSEIEDAIQTRMERGSISFINSLANVIKKGKISMEEAEKQLDDKGIENLKRLLNNTGRW